MVVSLQGERNTYLLRRGMFTETLRTHVRVLVRNLVIDRALPPRQEFLPLLVGALERRGFLNHVRPRAGIPPDKQVDRVVKAARELFLRIPRTFLYHSLLNVARRGTPQKTKEARKIVGISGVSPLRPQALRCLTSTFP